MRKPFVSLIKPLTLPCRIGDCQGTMVSEGFKQSLVAYTLKCDTCHNYAYVPRPMAERLSKEKQHP